MMLLLFSEREVTRKVIKFLSIGLLLALAGSIWVGCSEEPNISDPLDPVEMSVTVWPVDSAIDVDLNVKPTYTFSVELNDEMPEISIVRKSDGSAINHNLVKVSSKLYRIEFPLPLAEEETYDRYLSKAVGKNGEVLKKPLPQITSFTTTVVVIPSLVITAVNPQHNEEIPDTTTMLHYRADYELNPATVEPSFTLTNTTTGIQLNLTIDVSGKDIYVNVDDLLEHSSSYTAEFDAEIIRGLNGEKPTTTYSFSFTTEIILPPPVFTTPEGFLQTAGYLYEEKYFIGGYGPDEQSFISCFNWEGDSLWFKEFRVNGLYTIVTQVEVNSTGIYTLAVVNPVNPVTYELWLIRHSLNGEFIDMWQLTNAGYWLSITSSENEVFVNYLDNQTNKTYIQRYTASGLQAEISYFRAFGILYHNGYLYVSGAGTNNSTIFLSKWNSSLSDSLWYKEVQHNGITGVLKSYLTYASSRLWIIAQEINQQFSTSLIMQQYDEAGTLYRDITFPSSVGSISGICSDGINAYKKSNGVLHKIYLDGSTTYLLSIQALDIFRADDPSGIDHKIAITDNTNKLKFYNR